MISFNHTPGPWTVVPSNNIQTVGLETNSPYAHQKYWYTIEPSEMEGEQLAIVSGRQTVGAGPGAESKQEANRRRDEANARLIAAAPELLKALADLLGILEDEHYKCNIYWDPDSDQDCRIRGTWLHEKFFHADMRRANQAIAKAKGKVTA